MRVSEDPAKDALDRARFIEYIKGLTGADDRPLTSLEYGRRRDRPEGLGMERVKALFGSWSDAIVECGYDRPMRGGVRRRLADEDFGVSNGHVQEGTRIDVPVIDRRTGDPLPELEESIRLPEEESPEDSRALSDVIALYEARVAEANDASLAAEHALAAVDQARQAVLNHPAAALFKQPAAA